MDNSDVELLCELNKKLDTVIRLLASQVGAQHETIESKAVALAAAGLGPSEIAAVCGTTPNTVSVALSKAKRRSAKGRNP